MRNYTPMFPGFHLQTLRRKPRSAQQIFAEQLARIQKKSFKQLGELFIKLIPSDLLKPESSGAMSRRRLFSKENTFWAFLSQILDADGGCKEVVRKFQAYASVRGIGIPSSSTSSYCTARTKLDQQALTEILEHTAARLDDVPNNGMLNNRRVIVVDGTGVTMPDTAKNQEVWPQPISQKPGCGFPSARILACFSLASGALLSYAVGNKKSHELRHLRQLWDIFKAGDILLGDKGFCSYYDQAILKRDGVDSVITLARRKPVKDSKCLKVISPDDLLIAWARPKYSSSLSYSKSEWEKLPEELVLRQIRVTVTQPGFRTKGFYIITTLQDAEQYPAEDLAALYFKRWDVELFFRDLKTTIGMDILRCRTPEMVRKEILMHFIAYNCVRWLMCEAAKEADIDVRLVSFKGALQALRSWEPHLDRAKHSRAEWYRIIRDLYDALTDTPLNQRPGRIEPRCVKRRPKNYQRMTAPRHEMKEIPHRNKYRATTP